MHVSHFSSVLMQIKKIRMLLVVSIAIIIIILNSLTFYGSVFQTAHAQPTINDPNLTAEAIVEGLSFPTSMAFLDDNNILILEKEGSIRLVSNGILQDTPVLQIPVNSQNERGLLGIEVVINDSNITAGISNGVSSPPTVFLYFTEVGEEEELRNRVYKYQWNGQSLINPTLILDLPAGPGTNHQGGKLTVGPDGYLYVVVGEMQREGQLQNIKNGPAPDDTGVILRVNPADGSPSPGNPFSSDPANPLSKYYAYGIRNSFGIEFDPVTRQLWDAENGEDVFDEINLVQPGFNSGWKQVMGPIAANPGVSESSLVNFPGSQYADPVFSWSESRGVTDIEFFNSTAFGPSYQNGIFVGDITTGTLFYFEPNADRTGIALQSNPLLTDLIANSDEEISSVTFGTGFTGITDIETGPDGNLYILTFDRGAEGKGSLYRILPPGEGDAPVSPPTTVTPPPVDEQDEDDTEEQDAGDEANGGGEDNGEEEAG